MCSEEELQTILRRIREKSVELFGDLLDAVILYGSYARKTQDSESDIDVMIRVWLSKAELEAYQSEISVLASRLGLEYDVFVSPHLQDCETFEAWKNVLPFFKNVAREGIEV